MCIQKDWRQRGKEKGHGRKHAICKYVPLCAYNKSRDRERRKRDMGGSMLYVSMCHCVPTTRVESERGGRGTP